MNDLNRKKQAVGILSDYPSATLDYWIHGFINQKESYFTWINPRADPSKETINLEVFDQIIIVRYLPRLWIKTLYLLKGRGVEIILFLDDDLLNTSFINDLPIQYSLAIWWKISRHRNKLYSLINQLWVTNSCLAKRCLKGLNKKRVEIKIIEFKPVPKVINTPKIYRICYYGTTSHKLEIEWIRKLFIKIQKRRDDCILDIVVNNYWRRKFKKIERVRMLHPMNWETYLLDTGNRSIDLFLAPLVSTPFNLSRSPVKFLDAVRLGSVGIYSNCAPYSDFITNNVDGVLLPNNHEIWIEAIERLLANQEQRIKITKSALSRAREMIENTDPIDLE